MTDPKELLSQWPVENVSAAVMDMSGEIFATYGDTAKEYRLASVTKPLAAYACLIAVEEGAFSLDDAAGPDGATLRHLLAHAAGYAFDVDRVFSKPGRKRIYSNSGYQELSRFMTEEIGIPFVEYASQAVCEPLGMTSTRFEGASGAKDDSAYSSVDDLLKFVREVLHPTLLDPSTVELATTPQFAQLKGVVPGYGVQNPNLWGLGFEIRGSKTPHWTGTMNSVRTFGHYGSAGTFVWWDPDVGLACVALTDRNFDTWAITAWPRFNDAVLEKFGDA